MPINRMGITEYYTMMHALARTLVGGVGNEKHIACQSHSLHTIIIHTCAWN